MKKLTIIDFEVNNINGFVFTFLGIELGNFEGELLGMHFSKDYFIFSVAFLQFTVTKPF